MSGGCSSVDFTRFDFAVDDFTSSTDTSISTCHRYSRRRRTYCNHRPISDDANYSSLSFSWPSVPSSNFPTPYGSFLLDYLTRDTPIPTISARLARMKNRAPGSDTLSRNSVLNRVGGACLKCPARIMCCTPEAGLFHRSKYYGFLARHFHNSQSALLDQRICRTVEKGMLVSYSHFLDTIAGYHDYGHYTDLEFHSSDRRYFATWLHVLETLRRDKERVPEQLELWSWVFFSNVILDECSESRERLSMDRNVARLGEYFN